MSIYFKCSHNMASVKSIIQKKLKTHILLQVETFNMLKWQADLLLAANTILQCTNRICLNYGTCLNFGAFTPNKSIHEICVCADGFFGTNCEYADDLWMGISTDDTLSDSDDGNRSRRSSHNMDADSYKIQPEYETQNKTVKETEIKASFYESLFVRSLEILFTFKVRPFMRLLGSHDKQLHVLRYWLIAIFKSTKPKTGPLFKAKTQKI